MSPLYVSTDARGVEHSPSGTIHWAVPKRGASSLETIATNLVLRRPVALLDVLDERIFEVASSDDRPTSTAEIVRVHRARIVGETRWNTEMAVVFALNCAERVAGPIKVTLPDGTAVSEVIAEARHDLEVVCDQHGSHLGRLARLSALRRLRREHQELAALLTAELLEDERRDLEVLDDPFYADVRTVIDSVLAAVEALRHYAEPALYVEMEERVSEAEAHHAIDRRTTMTAPEIAGTPWGPVVVGGNTVLRFEPAWAAAREAARHAREAVKVRSGEKQQAAERSWQGKELGLLLNSGSPDRSVGA